ncbi:MAG: hypothetical protein Q9191_002310 [Dirinaria sp. TL-2023a]
MDKFFATQVKKKPNDDENLSKQASERSSEGEVPPKKLPRGVVLGKDGKPCRSCTSTADWIAMSKRSVSNTSETPSTNATSTTTSLSSDCPPDVDSLGRQTWTLLHTISASYPDSANPQQQSDMKSFLSLFSKIYPCWVCAEDFQEWMSRRGNEPKVEGRNALGNWMCEAHNEVNRKLGKEEFDCARWQERWRTGWKDGRCDP